MKSNNHQDPIQHMADRLREHALPYREGAWEQFQDRQQKKKMPMLLWPYFSAAAIMLLALTLFWPANKEGIMPVELATVKQAPKEEMNAPVEPAEALNGNTVNEKNLDQAEVIKYSNQDRTANNGTTALTLERKPTFLAEEKMEKSKERISFSEVRSIQGRAASLSLLENSPVVYGEQESSIQERAEEVLASSQARENKQEHSALENKNATTDFLSELLKIEGEEKVALNTKENKKWSVGLNVSPNISGNNQVNLGGGVALAYAVSPKISISSGVSYLQLDAERGVSSPELQSSPVSIESGAVNINVQSKTLEKVQANLVGLDIPLTLNYHINKRIFTSVGVSFFSVLRESGSLQYLNEKATMAYALDDTKTPEPVVRTFSTSEALQEKMYEGKSVSGFFNFSVGYAIPLSKKVGFAIEPFFKIPMGYISPEELNLSNGGVKISTRF